jgi:hypothetical protein
LTDCFVPRNSVLDARWQRVRLKSGSGGDAAFEQT